LVEEGMFRAARFGVEGQLPDTQGNRRPVSVLLDEALGRADAWAGELGCAEELARLPDLLERGGGAGMQRSSYEIAGIDAVLRELLDRTRGT
jgi:glutamate---cysteine ligase / carboxylate-amine ligase